MSLPGSGDIDLSPALRPVVESLRTLQRSQGALSLQGELHRRRLLLEELSVLDAAVVLPDLRRIVSILEELLGICRQPVFLDHADRWRTFHPVRSEERAMLEALGELERLAMRLPKLAWPELEQRLARLTLQNAPPLQDVVGPEVDVTLDEWLSTSTSLQRLRERLAPLSGAVHELVYQTAREQLIDEVSRPAALLELFGELCPALEAADLSAVALTQLAARATHAVSPALEDAPQLVGPMDVPLRPGRARFLELIRGQVALRRRLFGPAECPTEILAPTDKVRWFAGSARSEVRTRILERLALVARRTLEESCTSLVQGFVEAFHRAVACRIEARRRRLDSELERFEGILAEDDPGEHVIALEAALVSALDVLRPFVRRRRAEVEAVPVRFRSPETAARFAPLDPPGA